MWQRILLTCILLCKGSDVHNIRYRRYVHKVEILSLKIILLDVHWVWINIRLVDNNYG